MRNTIMAVFFLTSLASVQAQTNSLFAYSMESIDTLIKRDVRNIAVLLTADWCHFCKNMEINTLADEEVIKQLNEAFYFVNFDGESKDPVRYQNQTFTFKPSSRSSGTHELAEALGTIDGELTYPTFVIVNPKNEIVFQHSGFLNKDELLAVLISVD